MDSRGIIRSNRILVIAMRFLGDVLLTTALIRSIRLAYPQAQVDVLVFGNTAAMLEGNPDIDRIVTTPNKPHWTDYCKLLLNLFRHYDLAVTTQTGDRPFLYALLAAPVRVGVVPAKNATGWWKRFFMQRWTEFDDVNTHTVLQHLKLADLLAIPRSYELVPPQIGAAGRLAERFEFVTANSGYAVLHPHPQWTYKRWTVAGWVEIGHYLNSLGFTVVLSGGPAEEEVAYVADIAAKLPPGTVNLAGQVSLAELAYIIGHAELFIGPDTGITHMAAATGVAVITLYGPTNPVKWAPWPKGYRRNSNPFQKVGCQCINNINLIQGEGGCVPCHLEGCDRHRQSRSRCLDELLPERIKTAVRQLLVND
ncbi:putative lipopolysaccharide heptosyltransferase III [Methylomicrobium sp. Wu6]|uniref:putative lipopolysaccharide heptosyltransferase III n=1 Tax=Methylomicrobium sp. Wu6 TaxID=3107928 RepID=UPI002DD67643|nr:putative lipopolysaccharide heptosyltransferase III [Methylomicrobium sp. Wu6]MEC4748759.1 putative lipopolysaccharide heptosyltransferase III [Methylomicrobium sp. Wu6]